MQVQPKINSQSAPEHPLTSNPPPAPEAQSTTISQGAKRESETLSIYELEDLIETSAQPSHIPNASQIHILDFINLRNKCTPKKFKPNWDPVPDEKIDWPHTTNLILELVNKTNMQPQEIRLNFTTVSLAEIASLCAKITTLQEVGVFGCPKIRVPELMDLTFGFPRIKFFSDITLKF